MITAMDKKRMLGHVEKCKEADPKPMAARWYVEDVARLIKEIDRLEDERNAALWKLR